MADGDFPDKYETHTTTTTTTTTCGYNEAYLRSLPGLLRVAQIGVGLIYWILLAASYCVYLPGYMITTTIFAWIFTIIIFLLFFFMVADKVTLINWPLTEFINNILWGVLHLIGFVFVLIGLIRYCQWFGNFLQLVLSIAMTLLYLFHAFLLFKDGVIVVRSQSSTVQT